MMMMKPTHLHHQVHEALVLIAGDGRVRPHNQVAVNAGRQVNVLADGQTWEGREAEM